MAWAIRGWWNVRREGKWYQIHERLGQISSPGDAWTYSTLKKLQDAITMPENAMLIPFPLPLQQNFNYVYTLDLDSAHLTVSFWYHQEVNHNPGLGLSMRRFRLNSIYEPSDLAMGALLQRGSDPLFDMCVRLHPSRVEEEYKHWEIKVGHPSALNELQHRMFMDFVYQWRFFIDDHTVWQYPSSALFRRLCYGFLRLAAWDLEISSEWRIAQLPLGAESYPGWDFPTAKIYWYHGFIVVLCEDLETFSSVSAATTRAGEFLGPLKSEGKKVTCILVSLREIAFAQISADQIQYSKVIPLLTESSATQCSAGFRILTHFLARPYATEEKRKLEAREVSNIDLPTEVVNMILSTVTPYDIVSFAQASFMVENWYYSSLPQLPNLAIHHFDVSIPCCGERIDREGKEGVCCSDCYEWRHTECLDHNENTLNSGFLCSKCCQERDQAGTRSKLIPGTIGRANRRGDRPNGCRVMIGKQEKVLQLRITAPAALRLGLGLMDLDLTSRLSNQIDYVVQFNGAWSGLAFGLDDVRSVEGYKKGYKGRRRAGVISRCGISDFMNM